MKISYSPLWLCFFMETQPDQQELERIALELGKTLRDTRWGRGLLFALPAEKSKAISAMQMLFKRPETARYYMERTGLAKPATFVLNVNTVN